MRANASPSNHERLVRRTFQTLAVALFALQFAAFITAKKSAHRFFCWAPFDQHTRYVIRVNHHGEPLTDEAIEARYHLPARGINPRSYYEILGTIARFESTDGRHQRIEVTVTYNINGGPEQVWTWTSPSTAR